MWRVLSRKLEVGREGGCDKQEVESRKGNVEYDKQEVGSRKKDGK